MKASTPRCILLFMSNTMARQRMRAPRIRAAFTLIELLVVSAIIAILAALVLPSRLLAATILSCVNAATGEVIYRERLNADGQYCASPVVANGHLYLLSAQRALTVVKLGDKFEIVHRADLKAAVSATPALDPRSLYLRTEDALMAFRETESRQNP